MKSWKKPFFATVSLVFVILTCAPPATAASQPPIEIWLSQRMGRWGDYYFPALGGKSTHPTPRGKFRVISKYEDFYSRKYKSPMPLSLFFTDQCAIHVGSLRVSSHGCIHVDWQTGDYLFRYASSGKTEVRVYE
ncbi:MAG: L,D-transpeptidase [Candidatus Sumerlaeaceae bacterium]